MKTTKYLFLLLSMMVSHVAWGAVTTGKAGDNINYSFDSSTGVMALTGTGSTYASALQLRSDINTFYTNVKKVTIGEGITTIGTKSFANFTSLESFALPESLESINSYAFYGCTSLKWATFGTNVQVIENYAFYNCSSMSTVTFDTPVAPTVYSNTFYGIPSSGNLYLNCLETEAYKSLKNTCFSGWTTVLPTNYDSGTVGTFKYEYNQYTGALYIYGSGAMPDDFVANTKAVYKINEAKSVVIEGNVTSISKTAFQGCENLEIAALPNTVKTIGHSAFISAKKLRRINFPTQLTTIDSYAFNNCQSLTSVTLPNTVTTVGANCFDGCTGLTELTLSNNLTSFPFRMVCNAKITKLVIPATVTTMSRYAVDNCSNLSSIEFKDTTVFVTSISSTDSPFQGVAYRGVIIAPAGYYNNFTKFKHYYLPNWTFADGVVRGMAGPNSTYTFTTTSKKVIIKGTGAITTPFQKVTASATSIQISEGITELGQGCFMAMDNVPSLTLPSTLETIGDYALNSMSGLTSIEIPTKVTSIGNLAFTGCSKLADIYMSSKQVPITSSNSFSSVAASGTLHCPFTNDGSYKTYKEKYLPTAWKFDDGTTGKAGANATYTFTSSTGELRISGEGGMYDFSSRTDFDPFKTYVKSIVIESKISSIGTNAFLDFTNVESVSIGAGVTQIGNSAFRNCSKLESIVLPDNITWLSTGTFAGCTNLKTVTLPKNLQEVYNSFLTGSQKLESITFPAGLTRTSFGAISDCPNLKEVIYQSYNPPTYNGPDAEMVVGGSNTGMVKVPFGMGTAYAEFVSNHYPKGWILEDGTKGKAGDNILYVYDPKTNVLTLSGSGAMYGNFADMLVSNVILGTKSIIVGSGITSIGEEAFYNFNNVETVSLPDGLTSIGHGAFNTNVKLKDISIPNSVTSLGSNIFYGCKSLESATLPTGLTIIPIGLFDQCVSLKSITIPAGVTSIYAVAFRNCASLTEIKFLSTTPPGMFANVFANMPSTGTLYVPASAIAAYENYRDNNLPGWTVSTFGAVTKLVNLIQNLKSGTATKQDIDNWANKMIGK